MSTKKEARPKRKFDESRAQTRQFRHVVMDVDTESRMTRTLRGGTVSLSPAELVILEAMQIVGENPSDIFKHLQKTGKLKSRAHVSTLLHGIQKKITS